MKSSKRWLNISFVIVFLLVALYFMMFCNYISHENPPSLPKYLSVLVNGAGLFGAFIALIAGCYVVYGAERTIEYQSESDKKKSEALKLGCIELCLGECEVFLDCVDSLDLENKIKNKRSILRVRVPDSNFVLLKNSPEFLIPLGDLVTSYTKVSNECTQVFSRFNWMNGANEAIEPDGGWAVNNRNLEKRLGKLIKDVKKLQEDLGALRKTSP